MKAFYSRSANHPIIGAIQFPKIYRKTFKAHITELLEHAATSGEKVPSFFLNPFILDVTNEYFTTFDITAPLIKRNDEKADYAYACVMGSKRAWIPVGYGKIKSRRTKFHSLGSNNVYLPAYYQTGNMTPAGYPILLNDNGSALILCPDLVNTRSIKISSVAYFRPRLEEFKKSFNGCTIEGADNVNFKNSEILYQLANAYEPGTYRIPVCSNSKYRFIRFKIRNSTIKINEFKLFSASGETENELEGKPIYSDASDSLMLRKSVDHDKLTGANFDELSDEHKLSGNIWIGYDFKKPVSISAFEFYYALNVNIRDQGVYELLYWDFGWKSLGIKKSSSISVNFDKVPENALLMLKIHDTNSYSRIFTYSNEKQHWW